MRTALPSRVLRRFGVAFSTAVLACSGLVSTSPVAHASVTGGWTVASTPTPQGSWYAVQFVNNHWFALGHGSEIATSLDGVHWREHPVPAGAWQSLAYGNGRFVALSALATGAQEMTSTNGINWTVVAGPVGEWTGLTFGAGHFMAVSAFGQLVTSTNGVTWTTTWVRSQFLLNSVAYGDGRFIAVDSAKGDALISLNGRTWSFYPISTPGTPWYAVSYGDGVFTAFSATGQTATSMLGYAWVTHPEPATQQINASTNGCNTFVAVGQAAGATNNILVSHLGATWSASPVPTGRGANWTAVAYGANRFVAVDNAGDITTLHIPGSCGPDVPTPPKDVSGNLHSGEIWTYQHPPQSSGGAPVDGYKVTVSDGVRSWTCFAPVYYEPNCIIRGLVNGHVYYVTAQDHNRYGYSAPTDPEFAIPLATWSLRAGTVNPVVSQRAPVVIRLTGVIANAAGFYPPNFVSVHFGAQVFTCQANPFGECLITVPSPAIGRHAVYATYTGYGVYYRSPTTYTTVVAGQQSPDLTAWRH